MNRIEMLSLPDNADCAMITSDTSRRYFTGMKSSAGIILIFRDCAYLLIDFRYVEKARNTVKCCRVIEQENLKEQITQLMKKHNAHSIAVEAADMTLSQIAFYEKKFPEFDFIKDNELSDNITVMRSVKSSDEIEKIKSAQKIAEKAFDEILNFIKPGVTEREISLALDGQMLKNGAEALSFETIALCGSNTSMPHGVPSETAVKNGNFVLMDFGAVYDGYHSDMTRTVCVGEPSEKMVRVYDVVYEAQLKALATVRAGITGSELDLSARRFIEDAGFGECFGHSLGHGVGMEIHEHPVASSKSEDLLSENMIVTIEPGIYLPGEFGVRIEDFVVVTEKSCENLTKCPKKMIIL